MQMLGGIVSSSQLWFMVKKLESHYPRETSAYRAVGRGRCFSLSLQLPPWTEVEMAIGAETGVSTGHTCPA